MPELPEVEVLVRHLKPLLQGRKVREVEVHRPKVLAPTLPRRFRQTVRGAEFVDVARRGKYLLFHLRAPKTSEPLLVVGHLGMTGRMYLLPPKAALPKHAAVVLELGREQFVFEDTRYFGRLTLDARSLERLGPEPLAAEFTPEGFGQELQRSAQPVKVKLLDQSLVAGVGNIYASEALYRAGVSPRLAARRLKPQQVERLWGAIREVLAEAIECGSTIPLNFSGSGDRDGLFYFGRVAGAPDFYEERLRVYDRANRPCSKCGTVIKRMVQAARSTFYCPRCQCR
ncbi:MAG TPA: bifunctional DNA-formamidopyrimidine glycosylase/DNA-(apurinic or apyrimidinic site) lyase [Bacillota bacterium]|nr:bifunctional DNA-formamidopyrimidine glycosylase/DNA-(apurinic or apyrimidinic site) lyase [Bacillota bacterium]